MNYRKEPTETVRVHISSRDVIFSVATEFRMANIDAVDGIIRGWNSLTDAQKQSAMKQQPKATK